MSIWYPGSGSYEKYLQTNSFVRDINGQIKTSGKSIESKISEESKQIVASNEELSQIFSSNFDSMNNTLEWGFNRLSSNLNNINTSIDSLHSDFNYNMGLLLEELYVNNKLLSKLIEKLDAIHKTLQSPILTQAREFFSIGRERFSKGLLDKALEAFIKAAEKNDTDFFTQFQIGSLYLYGINADANVLNLEKAKKHLLLSARYGKAEISVDSSFAKLAAEALLHASISVYFQLGENNSIGNNVKTGELLQEAKRLATEAIELNPQLSEAYFHLAKYTALLSDSKSAIPNLEKAITSDRNYAIKVDIDHAFDPIRPHVLTFLSKLKDSKQSESKYKIAEAIRLLDEVSIWHPEESASLNSEFQKCKQNLKEAQKHYNYQTYFGFLDAIYFANLIIADVSSLKVNRINEIETQFKNIINDVINYRDTALISLFKNFEKKKNNLYKVPNFEEIQKGIDEINNLILQAQSQLKQKSYNSFKTGILITQNASTKIENHVNILKKIEDENDNEHKKELMEIKIKGKKTTESMSCAIGGCFIGGIIGFFSGFKGCSNYVGVVQAQPGFSHPSYILEAFSIWGTHIIVGVILGAVIGAIFGYIKES